VLVVVIKLLLQEEQFFMGQENHYYFGFILCGGLWHRRQVQVPITYRLMQQAVDTSPKPFKELIKQA
jgi:hypothetical protein